MERMVREQTMVQAGVVQRVHTVMESPLGPMTLVAAGGALCGVYMAEHRHRPAWETFGAENAEVFTNCIAQLTEYFEGRRTEFDLPTAPQGTPFQHEVWSVLREIPYGETVSYGWVAEQLGRPTASRAVGAANGRNPISIIVPCHRVVGANGSLTGYGGGMKRKESLLELERSRVAAVGEL
ncbi:methylated-DNA--[protein]-cysteine S-methyltransferase [Actinoalloteichus hymeniacidonis]|uniref:Methylated-DNA--protein-cysteine methyltransferase n=1 Tax=Actinoalloteichus hymeniacidonis TaxID=340345 RepID=A0AAC9HQD1_9PSEU|nr:methylated-DNA--[protein]-cysteine S-methyltransferase [Actinoalloteichus hymeniacidonis]AOS63574.1 O-6-methylguanine DNA methyltransferase [Actinoalloteichus hymeniacidonis]MBB5908380.1 methylated-DNA-[protein]-cysteine S-methyltransferase [Actinoalloteichus hymeniacidonis]